MQCLVVRVVSPDYQTWRNAVESAADGLRSHGVTHWKVYRETENPNEAVIIFYTSDTEQALAFFKSDEFKRANAASGATEREFFVATKQ